MTHGVKSRSKARSAAKQPNGNDELVLAQINYFFTPNTFTQAKALLEKGHSVADVSEFYGAPEHTVRAIESGDCIRVGDDDGQRLSLWRPEKLPDSAVRAIRRRIRDVECQLNKLKKIIKIAEDA